MNRQIKFRAWHKGQKQMFTALYLTFGGKIGMWNYEETEIDFASEYPYLELIEFTGLLDKNGKEIYDGDILKLQYPVNYGFGGIHDKEIIVKVIYESGAFWFEGEGYTDCNWHFYNDYEIIGNIYENESLLK